MHKNLIAQSVKHSSRANLCVRKKKVRPSLRPADSKKFPMAFSKKLLTDNH